MKLPYTFKKLGSGAQYLDLSRFGWDSFFQDQLKGNASDQTPARIVGGRKNSFLVSQGHEEMLATIAGSLLHDADACYPAVGDWVLMRDSVITAVLNRKNVLSRKAAGGRSRKKSEITVRDQVIATNLDTTFIVCGLDRDFNLRRIERYLTLVYNCGILPVVVLTKSDLHQCPERFVSEVESVALGVPIHVVSADHNAGLSQMEEYLFSGQTAALIGSSGSGKSTLINRLCGDEVRVTGSVSQSLGKGRHTTTNRDLIVLPSGAMIIDNPGIREVALGIDSSGAESAFPDIEMLSLLCKFQDCSHAHEPGCKVLEAVSSGELPRARLGSFQKIQSELEYLSHREIKGAARLEKERWKGVSQDIKLLRKRGKH